MARLGNIDAGLPATSPMSSPFDQIRQVRADGSEFWSARDLMPLMGYSRWESFMTPIERAMKTAENQGMGFYILFLRSQEKDWWASTRRLRDRSLRGIPRCNER
ncbi:hypothetical protein M2284_002641 [Rhodococcus sp. LBL1]|nr:hypothetical protein [Rhodococcus sp. LBL1]MDH6684025.1 hypothetical protein [Rhodococcus sp. LBL2]